MAEEESGEWGSVDTRDVIVRLTGQQTNHATSKLLTLYTTLGRVLTHLANPISKSYQTYFSVTIKGFYIVQCLSKKKSNKQLLCTNTTEFGRHLFFLSLRLFRLSLIRDLIG